MPANFQGFMIVLCENLEDNRGSSWQTLGFPGFPIEHTFLMDLMDLVFLLLSF